MEHMEGIFFPNLPEEDDSEDKQVLQACICEGG